MTKGKPQELESMLMVDIYRQGERERERKGGAQSATLYLQNQSQ